MPQCLHLYKGTHLLPKLLIAVRHTARQTQATLPGNFAQNGEYLRWNERQEEHVPFLKWRVFLPRVRLLNTMEGQSRKTQEKRGVCGLLAPLTDPFGAKQAEKTRLISSRF